MIPRWVKLPCNLCGSFAPDNVRKDFECRVIYMHLLMIANWDDGDEVKRGECIVNAAMLGQLCPYFDRSTIRRSMARLKELGFIDITRVSKWDNDGHRISILHYDLKAIPFGQLEDSRQGVISQHMIESWPPNRHQTATNLATKDIFNEPNLQDNSSGFEKVGHQFGHQVATKPPHNTIELKNTRKKNNTGQREALSADADRGADQNQNWRQMAQRWNDTMPHAQKVKIDILAKNTKLQKSINDAIKAFGISEVVAVMERTKCSKFLTGQATTFSDRKPFKLKIDWFFKIANYQKIAEGSYDDVAIDARQPFIQ